MSLLYGTDSLQTIISIVFSLWSFGLSVTAAMNFFTTAPFLHNLLLVSALGELLLCAVYYKIVVKPRLRTAGRR